MMIHLQRRWQVIYSATTAWFQYKYLNRTGGKFDQLTGSKVTETILSRLDKGGVDLLVGQLQEMFSDPVSATITEDR